MAISKCRADSRRFVYKGHRSGVLTPLYQRPSFALENLGKGEEGQVVPEQPSRVQGMRVAVVQAAWAAQIMPDQGLRGPHARRPRLFSPGRERLPRVLAFHYMGADAPPDIRSHRVLIDKLKLHVCHCDDNTIYSPGMIQ